MQHRALQHVPKFTLTTGSCWSFVVALLLSVISVGCEPSTTTPDAGHRVDGPASERRVDAVVNRSGVDFQDVASARGLTYVFPEQPRPMRTLESFGCGCASFDFNNDGWQDILLVTDPCPTLYRNSGDGNFVQIAQEQAFADVNPGNWTGCAIGDYNGDGWLDVLFTGYHQLCLCRNDQGEKFLDVTVATGLDPTNHDHWGAGAGFMDLDGDMWPELVILNYVKFDPESQQYCKDGTGADSSCPPTAYEPEYGEIWHNTRGEIFEMTPPGVGMANTSGVGLVLAFTDLDNDGRCDFYIGNDARNADLMHNLGELKFENEAMISGVAVNRKLAAIAAMGADWGDFDRDGRMDLMVTDFQDKGSVLFRNLGDRLFLDFSESVGIEQATSDQLGFGLNWLDFDNDGWLDVGYVNGHVYENIANWRPLVGYRQPITLLQNSSGKRFINLTPHLKPEVSRPMVGRGSASTDFDNDGRMDFLVVDYEGPVMLLQNKTPSKNHWLKLDLHGHPPNTFAYGARVTATSNGQTWTEQVSPSSSYLSSKDPRVHLGLGENENVDLITIRWPSGRTQLLEQVAADRIIRIDEPHERHELP